MPLLEFVCDFCILITELQKTKIKLLAITVLYAPGGELSPCWDSYMFLHIPIDELMKKLGFPLPSYIPP